MHTFFPWKKVAPKNLAPLVIKNWTKKTIAQYEGENWPNVVTLLLTKT
jgi:hypothetical protein